MKGKWNLNNKLLEWRIPNYLNSFERLIHNRIDYNWVGSLFISQFLPSDNMRRSHFFSLISCLAPYYFNNWEASFFSLLFLLKWSCPFLYWTNFRFAVQWNFLRLVFLHNCCQLWMIAEQVFMTKWNIDHASAWIILAQHSTRVIPLQQVLKFLIHGHDAKNIVILLHIGVCYSYCWGLSRHRHSALFVVVVGREALGRAKYNCVRFLLFSSIELNYWCSKVRHNVVLSFCCVLSSCNFRCGFFAKVDRWLL